MLRIGEIKVSAFNEAAKTVFKQQPRRQVIRLAENNIAPKQQPTLHPTIAKLINKFRFGK